MGEEKFSLSEDEDFFGMFYPLIADDDITDIDYNGADVWLTDSGNSRRQWEGKVTEEFVEQFTKRIANCVSKPFHKQQPILEAETDRLRITIVHESVARSGRCICIRKSLPYVRFDRETILRERYVTPEVLGLLVNCVKARMNLVFCGEPGVGKTECAKFFSGYIPGDERVITIEDNPEWHYGSLHPGRDCVELQISPRMDYSAAIKTCLRLNPKWIMLSETRSTEVVYLMEGFSTGVRGMTTLHTDDVRNIPDRMLNMAGNQRDARRMENDIYAFVDVGILLRRREMAGEDGRPQLRRYIDQVCFFTREDGQNRVSLVMDEGRLLTEELPGTVQQKFRNAGIEKPFQAFLDAESVKPASAKTVSVGLEAVEPMAMEPISAGIGPMAASSVVRTGYKGGTYYGTKAVV